MVNNKGKQDKSYVITPSYGIKYVCGTCKICKNDYSDLNMHYTKNPEHKVR